MKIYKVNQAGSHVVAVGLTLCVLGLVIFTGLRVFGGRNHAVGVNTKTEAAGATTPVPSGWKSFADKSIGVQFIYPEVYGTFIKPTEKVSKDYESVLVSTRLTADYLPGVAGQFTLGTYKNASPEVTTRRYGPKVKLSGGEWTVTEPNPYDTTRYQKGNSFPEITRSNTHGIDVYSAKSGEEGIIVYNLYFVSQGKLHVLQVPPFNSDLGTSTYNINDQSAYDTMLEQIRSSVALY